MHFFPQFLGKSQLLSPSLTVFCWVSSLKVAAQSLKSMQMKRQSQAAIGKIKKRHENIGQHAVRLGVMYETTP